MRLKTLVEDRISTYPGRVVLNPVAGAENTYDMVRADVPIAEGTPMNKALFDNKAYAVMEDAVVYVSTSGSDITGDGSSDAPFATIQKAIDEIPKVLDGHTVTVDIASGTYEERILVDGFMGGKLVVGVYGRNVTVRGVEIVSCSNVETNIAYITNSNNFNKPLYLVDGGSKALIGSAMQLDAGGDTTTGISATNSSVITVQFNETISVSNCYGAAVNADKCSLVSIATITGVDNVVGLSASRGGIISYQSNEMQNMWGNSAGSGGLVLTGENSSELSGATLDL